MLRSISLSLMPAMTLAGNHAAAQSLATDDAQEIVVTAMRAPAGAPGQRSGLAAMFILLAP